MLFALIVVIHVLVSLVIIALVLLQAGKGADIGSAFGGGGSQAVFGSMGTPTVLGKLTSAVAIVFMLTSFTLAILSHRRTSTIMPASAPIRAPASAPAAPPAPPAPAGTPATAPGQK
ncbi:MAG TPA: preprotein translocase subunit SecG [Candidatus Methylomirabilis sp.]|nr:preprotein translocase subunit SecG [Candidatus Methylomirabilis sp.]